MLLIFGVTAVSSYAILFIRDYLLEEGQKTIFDHSIWIALTVSEFREGDEFFVQKMKELEAISDYEIVLFDIDGNITYATGDYFAASPLEREKVFFGPELDEHLKQRLSNEPGVLINEPSYDKLYVFSEASGLYNSAGYVRVSKEKRLIYEPITNIRWIIYTGMFISIGVILLVSNLFARYLSRPITELQESAQKVAEGKAKMITVIGRTDEFGDLASSINSMALQLREDNERLSAINEKQSRFFADITHEIRNPLHTIMASMELLEVGTIDKEKQIRYIQNARSQAERIGSLFKDLLTLQRYDSDENFIQAQWFDLQRVTGRIEELYIDEANKKGITLHIQKTPCRVLADAPKIEQVFDNLISNALKYTNEGEVGLEYEIKDRKVYITVFDTGIGIAADHITNLFDRFYRTDKARSRDNGGTGLGLSVVKSILEAHGSEIFVESTPGSGTRFWFTLTAKS